MTTARRKTGGYESNPEPPAKLPKVDSGPAPGSKAGPCDDEAQPLPMLEYVGPDQRGQFSERQVQQLLRPINPRRVLADPRGNSHVSQQDVLAHLSRVFGFGNFDLEVLAADLVFEMPRATPVDASTRWDVCYRAMVRVTVRNKHGVEVCHFENGSTHTAQNQKRGEAHDGAYKSAISLSVKRACIALGDQFGLSLYNKGQLAPLVGGVLVGLPEKPDEDDVQEHATEQVSLGNDETEPPPANDTDATQGHLNRATGQAEGYGDYS
jgi:hypothetical protein